MILKPHLPSRFPTYALFALSATLILSGLLLLEDEHAPSIWSADSAPEISSGISSGKILADQGSPISVVVTSLSSARRSALRNVALMNEIVNQLPERIHFLVLVNDPEAFAIQRNPWPDRVDFVLVPPKVDLTIWPQDPFLVFQREDGETELLTSRDFTRAGDVEMADFIAERLGWHHAHSELSFAGGNVVSGSRTSFIGADTIRVNAIELEVAEKEIAERFAALLGRRVVVIGPVPQPVGHIDMVLTPLGVNQVLLADPGWGAEIASRGLQESPEQIASFEADAEQMFFGHPEISELAQPEADAIRPPRVIGRTQEIIAESRELAEVFDVLAKQLQEQGFEIHRVPYFAPRARPPESQDDSGSTKGATYPTLTYNNVLLEESAGEQHVFLPQYGWEALDLAARKAWEKLGYRVHPIYELTTSAMYGGALRCSVKVLAR